MSNDPSDRDRNAYLLGSDDDELVRLAFQHRVWADQAGALWRRAGFGYGETILDLGCGPGYTSIDLSQLVGPEGEIVAVDGAARFLAYLREQAEQRGIHNIRVVGADAQQLDLPAESIDGAYARWLFCFLSDPGAVVDRLARVLRPGAPVAITDYFNYRAFTFAPRSEVLDRVVVAVEACWRRQGGDLDIQGRLPGMLADRGFEIVEVSQVCRIAEPGTPSWNWPRTFFRTFMNTLLEAGLVTDDDRREFDREWELRAKDPTSRLYLPPMIDVIARKPSFAR